ncbi:MAG: hypothetical protein GXZ15_04720 [Campylobacter sp.]|nr:hypothetical protein [Campylobacter sp.]
MNFLRRNNRHFYTILLDNDLCKVYFRELNSQKSVVSEGIKTFKVDGKYSQIGEYIEQNASYGEKDYVCVFQTSHTQGLTDVMIDGFYVQYIDENIYSYANLSDIRQIEESAGVHINEFISPFKVLYFLHKNQNFEGVGLFVLKFSSLAVLMVADHGKIYSAKTVDLTKEFMNLINNDESIVLDDWDELFYRVIRDFIFDFYTQNESFINGIYIYDTGGLSPEIGYYIFTKIFIKTNIVPLNLMDFINKINIKENF